MSPSIFSMESVESVVLSPCSSGGTMVDLGHVDYGLDRLSQTLQNIQNQDPLQNTQNQDPLQDIHQNPHQEPNSSALKIVLPNLMDHIIVAKPELDAFVAETKSNASILHLLIYLFAKKVHPQIQSINNIKLLHIGRMYHVGKLQHLWAPTPLINDIIEMFPTFQLLICPNIESPPLEMSICRMLQSCSSATPNIDSMTPPATYAEAMVRMFRSRRNSWKNLVDTLDSSQSGGATRFLSRGSITDTEEGSSLVMSLKIKRSFKRILRKTRLLGLPSQYGFGLDHRL